MCWPQGCGDCRWSRTCTSSRTTSIRSWRRATYTGKGSPRTSSRWCIPARSRVPATERGPHADRGCCFSGGCVGGSFWWRGLLTRERGDVADDVWAVSRVRAAADDRRDQAQFSQRTGGVLSQGVLSAWWECAVWSALRLDREIVLMFVSDTRVRLWRRLSLRCAPSSWP